MANRIPLDRESLNESERLFLDKLVASDPSALSDAELEHLKARQDYLRSDEFNRFAKVLGLKKLAGSHDEEEEEVEQEEEAPVKKGKK